MIYPGTGKKTEQGALLDEKNVCCGIRRSKKER